ncbi:hypothetical protein J3A83DRAFT_4414393, partial [Scleroderma citrinum]
MSNRPLQDDPNCYLQQIHSLNIHFATTPIKHFDEQEEHLLSKVSALDGAITLPTNGILSVLDVSNRVPPEGVGYVLMDSLFSRLFFMKEANRDDEDTQLAYLNRDGRDRKFEFLCGGRRADGRWCDQLVSFDSCADHLDQYHDTSSSNYVPCPWCSHM